MARSKNLSVEQFQQLMKRIPKVVAGELQSAMDEQANRLAGFIKAAAPTGTDEDRELRNSVRVEKGRRRPLMRIVRAGGPLTTKSPSGGVVSSFLKGVRAGLSGRSGTSYDYAIAQEFGTEHHAAQPFFYPTVKRRKRAIKSAIARRVKKAIGKVVAVK